MSAKVADVSEMTWFRRLEDARDRAMPYGAVAIAPNKADGPGPTVSSGLTLTHGEMSETLGDSMNAGSFRRLGALHNGELAMLAQPMGDRPRGSLVRVERSIDTAGAMAYLVQPLVERRDERGTWQLVPEGERLTLESSELAQSLPGLRSGPQTLSGLIAQAAEDLIKPHRDG